MKHECNCEYCEYEEYVPLTTKQQEKVERKSKKMLNRFNKRIYEKFLRPMLKETNDEDIR